MYVVGELNEKTVADVVLYSYGNLETADQIYGEICSLYNYLNPPTKTTPKTQRPIVCYDYPGYGNHNTEEWLGGPKDAIRYAFNISSPYWDICSEANFSVYTQIKNIAPSAKIILWGRSIGSVPVCSLLHRLSRQERLAKISFTIIQSGLASLIQAKFPKMYTLSHIFNGANNLKLAENDKSWGTVVFIYGKNDTVVSTENPSMLIKALCSGNNIEIAIENQNHNIPISVILDNIKQNKTVSALFHKN